MGWYRNQKARHEAKKAGLPRPRTGGLGDKLSDKVEAGLARSKAREAEIKARKQNESPSHPKA